ncbi:MAG: toxin-antitoxin system HicB family antitoxin [Smithella sp.]|jgi:antitoxin HicB
MKDIKYYKNLNYKMIFYYDAEDKVYIVQFPELPGCISHGKTAKEALKHAYIVKDEWLESAFDDNCIIPEPSLPLETNGRITLRIPKSIHQKLIDRAEEEDVSQNQLIVSLIAEGLERTNINNSIKEILQKQARDILSFKFNVKLFMSESS